MYVLTSPRRLLCCLSSMLRGMNTISSFNVARSVIRFLDDFGIVRYGQPIPRSGVGDSFPYKAHQASMSQADLLRERGVEFAYLLEENDEGTVKRFDVWRAPFYSLRYFILGLAQCELKSVTTGIPSPRIR